MLMPLITKGTSLLRREAIGFGDTGLEIMIQEARRDGYVRAMNPGECDYWNEHVDEIYELRQAVAAGMTR